MFVFNLWSHLLDWIPLGLGLFSRPMLEILLKTFDTNYFKKRKNQSTVKMS